MADLKTGTKKPRPWNQGLFFTYRIVHVTTVNYSKMVLWLLSYNRMKDYIHKYNIHICIIVELNCCLCKALYYDPNLALMSLRFELWAIISLHLWFCWRSDCCLLLGCCGCRTSPTLNLSIVLLSMKCL